MISARRSAVFALSAALLLALAASALAGPQVRFESDILGVSPGAAATSPPVLVQDAAGVSSVTLEIAVPASITINTATEPTSGNLACVTKGSSASLFFSEWNASQRKISVTCTVTPGATLELVHAVSFSTSAGFASAQLTLGGTITGGAGSPSYGTLSVRAHTVTIAAGPAVDPASVSSSGTAHCSVSAIDSVQHAVTYLWSDGGAGGSFSPSATSQNPSYIAPANTTGADRVITLVCTAACQVNTNLTDTGSANLTVHSVSHTVTITSGPTATPSTVASAGATQCSATAVDSLGHGITYHWSDGGAGGSFSPSQNVRNPSYTTPANQTSQDRTVTLTCTATCQSDAGTSANKSTSLTVQFQPHTVSITTGPTADPTAVNSGERTLCGATATDSLGHSVTYHWSDGGAGGSFTASPNMRNPYYNAPANQTGADRTVTLSCTATCMQNSSITDTRSVALTVHPAAAAHTLAITQGPTATPATVGSGGTTQCGVTAVDSLAHAISYQWSDGGAGGSFSPNAGVRNPTYTAAANQTGADKSVTLTCTVTCQSVAGVHDSGTAALTVLSRSLKTVQVTSSPSAGVPVVFSPTPDNSGHASPKATDCTLGYYENTTGVQLTAPAQDGAANPRLFDHWVLDAQPQPQGIRTISISIGIVNHQAQAVYAALVGDLNADGSVNKTDADLILQAILGDIPLTAQMDVNQDGKTSLKDARWILQHPYAAPL